MKFRGPKAPIDILDGPVFGGWVTRYSLEYLPISDLVQSERLVKVAVEAGQGSLFEPTISQAMTVRFSRMQTLRF